MRLSWVELILAVAKLAKKFRDLRMLDRLASFVRDQVLLGDISDVVARVVFRL